MKTQTFTEQQLKDLVAGKEVVTVEPVKEGEQILRLSPNGKIKFIVEPKGSGLNALSEVGEVVQAVNEKGENVWKCSFCGSKYHNYKPDSLGTKPLLVQLVKIEKATPEMVGVPTFVLERRGDAWLKTWKVVK